jgi:hypothetical protein
MMVSRILGAPSLRFFAGARVGNDERRPSLFYYFEPTKPEETPKNVEKIAFHVENRGRNSFIIRRRENAACP